MLQFEKCFVCIVAIVEEVISLIYIMTYILWWRESLLCLEILMFCCS